MKFAFWWLTLGSAGFAVPLIAHDATLGCIFNPINSLYYAGWQRLGDNESVGSLSGPYNSITECSSDIKNFLLRARGSVPSCDFNPSIVRYMLNWRNVATGVEVGTISGPFDTSRECGRKALSMSEWVDAPDALRVCAFNQSTVNYYARWIKTDRTDIGAIAGPYGTLADCGNDLVAAGSLTTRAAVRTCEFNSSNSKYYIRWNRVGDGVDLGWVSGSYSTIAECGKANLAAHVREPRGSVCYCRFNNANNRYYITWRDIEANADSGSSIGGPFNSFSECGSQALSICR